MRLSFPEHDFVSVKVLRARSFGTISEYDYSE